MYRCLLICVCLSSLPAAHHFEFVLRSGQGQSREQGEELTPQRIAALRAQAEAASLDQELRQQILAEYDRASTELAKAAQFVKAAADDQQRIADAESTGEELDRRIAAIEVKPPPGLGADLSVKQLEDAVVALDLEAETLRTELSALNQRAQDEEKRPGELTARQTALPDELRAKAEEVSKAPDPADDPLLAQARRIRARAERMALEAEGPATSAELSRLTAERANQITEKEVQFTERRIARLDAETLHLKRLQNAARVRESEIGLGDIPPGTEEARIANEWLERKDELVKRLIPEATRKEILRKQELQADQEIERTTKEVVDELGVVVSVGLRLQSALKELRDIREIEQAIHQRESELAEATNDRREYQVKLRAIRAELGTEIAPERERLLRSQETILAALFKYETEFIRAANALDTQERLLVRTNRQFEEWLRERVLWVRSNEIIGPTDITESARTIRWLFSAKGWQELPETVFEDAQRNTGEYLLVAVLFVILSFYQPRCRDKLMIVGADAGRAVCTRFTPTAQAVGLTLVISLMWPVVIGFLGFRLTDPPRGSEFSQAIGRGLEAVAVVFLLLNLLRQICRNEGLGEAHFSWDDDSVTRLRQLLRVMMVSLVPLAFVGTMIHSGRDVPGGESLERLCFIVAMLLIGWFSFLIFHPRQGPFASALAEDQSGWSNRTRWIWFPLSFGMPLALATLAAAGYFFTASELSWRLAGMVWLTVGLVIAQALLVRWQSVSQRRIRMEQARKRRRAMLESGVEADAVAKEEEHDFAKITCQTRRLINTGLFLTGVAVTWVIWSGVLPAVSFLDEWELWQTTREVSVTTMVDDVEQLETRTVPESITPLDVIAALFFTLVTITAARNLPGLLEVVLFQHLPLEPALRYALRTVTRYLIVIIGVTLAFSAIGVGWEKVQWLMAGLTVGLGFGLQEIFANFVSGLIILFERPVRIGDIVTIDDVTGTVSRIQIRATTVTDWDRKEYIVPNKELVTGRLLNWTLTDKTNRILIEVGVAYGSDTQQARDLLVQVASEHPLILEEPAPGATFEQFADSALILKLRCYLPNFDNRLSTITELHDSIDQAFARAGIEIAFPQLDVNVSNQTTAEGLSD